MGIIGDTIWLIGDIKPLTTSVNSRKCYSSISRSAITIDALVFEGKFLRSRGKEGLGYPRAAVTYEMCNRFSLISPR